MVQVTPPGSSTSDFISSSFMVLCLVAIGEEPSSYFLFFRIVVYHESFWCGEDENTKILCRKIAFLKFFIIIDGNRIAGLDGTAFIDATKQVENQMISPTIL